MKFSVLALVAAFGAQAAVVPDCKHCKQDECMDCMQIVPKT